MKHGAPDWSVYRPSSTSYPVLDLAELAARLGSIDTFDRRGDILFLEDFESGLNKWWFDLTPTGAAAALDPTHTRSKGYSLKLTTGTDDDFITEASHDEPFPALGTFGLEVSATNEDDLPELGIWIFIFTGTVRLTGALFHLAAANALAYLDDTAIYQTLDAVNLPDTDYLFNTFKLVIDAQTQMYKHAILNSTQYDLSAYPLYAPALVTAPFMRVLIHTVGNGDDNYSIYVDDIILTRDEP